MKPQPGPSCTAFDGERRIASGDLGSVARAAKEVADRGDPNTVRVFADEGAHRVDVDLTLAPDQLERQVEWLRGQLAGDAETGEVRRRGPGRPKLGVVPKEVTLLPRHWAWLASQRGSVSAVLRRLVDDARKRHEESDRVRRAQDAAYRFMNDALGNAPGFEEALRALYAGDRARFRTEAGAWPSDLRDYALTLAEEAFHDEGKGEGR